VSDDSSDGPDVWVDDTDESPPDGPEPGDTLAVGDALSGAAARLVRPIGLALVAGYLLVGFAGAVATTSLFATLVPRVRAVIIENSAATPADFPPLADPSPLALPVEVSTALGLVLVTALLAETLNVVAIQVFVRDAREFPREALADLPARSLVSFVLPGVFLAVAFYLVRAAVAVEGAGVVPALRRSWRLVKGHRIRVLFVLLVVVLVGQVATLPGSVAGTTPLAEPTAAALGVVLGAVVTAFGAAVAARVYVQLAGIDAAGSPTPERDDGPDAAAVDEAPTDDPAVDEDEPIGALTPEEIDEQFGDDN
jgi:hypothetical protein